MPLYKDIRNKFGRILIWHVTESLSDLMRNMPMKSQNLSRIHGMKSEVHKRAFVSVRHLLTLAGFTDEDLTYDIYGKPSLPEQHISITHSHHFAAIVISDDVVGIDLEWAREKILNIADKFAMAEGTYLKQETTQTQILKLTVIWGIKEAIFKIRNERGISFKDHIEVPNFELTSGEAIGNLHFHELKKTFAIHFEIFDDFVLVCAANIFDDDV